MPNPVKAGIIGCGNISPAYFNGCKKFDMITIDACADLNMERAQARAKEFDVPRVLTVDQLLADPAIEMVINLTVPKAHLPVNTAALKAGKHVFCEKPFAMSTEAARATVDLAKSKGLLVGGAPDTFLGGGHQTCRKLIDDGAIGTPVAAVAFMCCHGHESWHPDPEFYYEAGGGPLWDMGPYYLTALVNLLGPIRRVAGSQRISFPTRTITSEPKSGKVVQVETDTHISAVIDFVSGPVLTLIMSFDLWSHNLPWIEVYGSEGTLAPPDPNGPVNPPVKIGKPGAKEWEEVPLTHFSDVGRGIGPADMACAIRSGRPHRANGDLTSHVVEVMEAIGISSREGRHVEIQSRPERPAMLPAGMPVGQLDA